MNGWIDKESDVYICSGILFVVKNEGNPAMCNNMDESWGHFTNWNKPVQEWQILPDSTYMKYLI